MSAASTPIPAATSEAQTTLIGAWAAFGINIVSEAASHWQWQETASEDDPPDWLGILSPPFSPLAACISDLEASLGPLPSHLQPHPAKDTP